MTKPNVPGRSWNPAEVMRREGAPAGKGRWDSLEPRRPGILHIGEGGLPQHVCGDTTESSASHLLQEPGCWQLCHRHLVAFKVKVTQALTSSQQMAKEHGS